MRNLLLLPALSFVAIVATTPSPQPIFATEPANRLVSFADDVQPILRRNCYRCHGSKNQEADLQLNDADKAYGESIIVKHDADASLLIGRLVDEDLGDIMPLDGQPLSQQDISVLRKWIDQGANWPAELAHPKHWAYEPIRRPTSKNETEAGSPIDQFVRQKLSRRDIEPARPADRARLIRRVSLALTGVPPSPQEVSEFVNDKSANAYEKVVDRLLQSQRYGERWAVPWLDLARYADSNGFQADQIRDNWAYRDWVIRSFNNDLPFDEFVIDQIAGDLRPDATTDQKVATGFHRMTTCNVEAGVHPEANRTNQIVDRVNTTATVFLGMTLECAQCHDHKYDPISQKEYYQLFAYFNNTPLEVNKTGPVTFDFYGPTMDLPMSREKQSTFESLAAQLEQLKEQRTTVAKRIKKDFQPWLSSLQEKVSGGAEWQNVVPNQFETTGKESFEIQDDGAVLLSGEVPGTVEHKFTFIGGEPFAKKSITAIRVDLLTDDSLPGKGPGRGDPNRTNVILSELTCELIDSDKTTTIEMQDAVADFSQSNWHVSQAIDGDKKKGWAFSPQFGKPHWASFVLSQPVALDSANKKLTVNLGQFYGRGRVAGKPRISIFTGDPAALSIDEKLLKLAKKKKLSPADRKKLVAEFEAKNPELKRLDGEIKQTQAKIDLVQPDTTLVMVEMEKPRETFVMLRGDYENLGDQVSVGVPSVLPQVDESNRRG